MGGRLGMTTWSGSDLYSHPGTLLRDHLKAVAGIAVEAVLALPLAWDWIDPRQVADVVYAIAAGHDLGKSTAYFQRYLSSAAPEKARLKNEEHTHHARLSALMVCAWVSHVLAGQSAAGLPADVVAAMAYAAVRRHHGSLHSLLDDLARLRPQEEETLAEQINSIPEGAFAKLLAEIGYPGHHAELKRAVAQPEMILKGPRRALRQRSLNPTHSDDKLECFFLAELLFSTLIDTDRRQAAGAPRSFRTDGPSAGMVDDYRLHRGWTQPKDRLGELRNKLYEGVVQRVEEVPPGGLFTITAPTGSGKTLAALAFALGLRERLAKERAEPPRIIYTLPFLSIIDQIHRVFRDVLRDPASDVLLAHHHLTDVFYRRGEDEFEPDMAEMFIEGWESEVIVTSFVQLFHTLIGHRGRSLRRFHRLVGSVVLLDEVQCLPHRYWLLLRQAAAVLSKRFGLTFILMTATQPAIFPPDQCFELAAGNDQLFHALDRVDFEVSLGEPLSLDALAQMVAADMDRFADRDVLVVLNTIASARSFLEALQQLAPGDGEYYFLSSHVVPKERLSRIEKATACPRRKVIVSTQVVEAGVDLDCDLVYRDFAPLDALVQVAGRCNRHGEKAWRGRARVVRLMDVSSARPREYSRYIYDPFLLECTRRAFGSMERRLREVEFLDVVQRYYHLVAEGLSDESSRLVLKAMGELNFDGGEESVSRFELIRGSDQADVFVETDGEAQALWQRYQELRQVADLGERRRRFAPIKGEFGRQVIGVRRNALERNPPPLVGHLYYIPLDLLEEYYDPTTGFRAEGPAVEVW